MHVPDTAGPYARRAAPIIDVCEVAYDSDCWHAYLASFAVTAPRYLEVFGGRLARIAGADPHAYRSAVETDPLAAVDLLVGAGGLATDFDRHARDLAEQGVRLQVLHGGMWKVPGGNVNDRLAGAIAGHPVLQFWAGLSLNVAVDALREAQRAHRELGARGLSLVPFLDGADILDPAHEPLFRYAERNRIPMWIHCGHSFAPSRPLDSCGWWHIDRLAARYPDLVIIAGHGGWPWMAEMAAVAQRHRRVYLDSSTHRAAAMLRPGYGWEPVLARADGLLGGKLVFGSTTWATGRRPREQADEFSSLGLRDTTVACWLGGNAARITGLEAERP